MLTVLRMLAGKLGWLILSVVVVTALLALWEKLPTSFAEWRKKAISSQEVAQDLRADNAAFSLMAAGAAREADREIADIRRASYAQLAEAEREIATRRDTARSRILDANGVAWAMAKGKAERIAASYRAEYVDLPLLDRTAELIELRLKLRKIAAFNEAVEKHNRFVVRHNNELNSFRKKKARAAAQWRNPVCREIDLPPICDLTFEVRNEAKALAAERKKLDDEARILETRGSAIRALKLGRENVVESKAVVRRAVEAYAQMVDRVSSQASGYVWNQASDALRQNGWKAFWIVFGAVLLPILLKLIAYFVIAPASQKARPVRLHLPAPSMEATDEGMSVTVPLDSDCELLLRSGLQSSSVDIRGSDKLVLDWGMPLSCIAAGLVNLQRLRSNRPDYVTVSGPDEAHRVTTLEVPVGGAVVLQPRALLGVVKARGQQLNIRRPWRIRWLISWITAQFRYVVFHGPCILIVQGQGGVMVEEAGGGRMINKRLTIGFDAALGYGAVRSPSFLPFLRGQASLFNDRFEGIGRYIYEQRASGTQKGSLWGRGLKGLWDAILSALGI